MPIIDNILIGEGSNGEYRYPTTPLGNYIEQLVKENILKYGDITWMVKIINILSIFSLISLCFAD